MPTPDQSHNSDPSNDNLREPSLLEQSLSDLTAFEDLTLPEASPEEDLLPDIAPTENEQLLDIAPREDEDLPGLLDLAPPETGDTGPRLPGWLKPVAGAAAGLATVVALSQMMHPPVAPVTPPPPPPAPNPPGQTVPTASAPTTPTLPGGFVPNSQCNEQIAILDVSGSMEPARNALERTLRQIQNDPQVQFEHLRIFFFADQLDPRPAITKDGIATFLQDPQNNPSTTSGQGHGTNLIGAYREVINTIAQELPKNTGKSYCLELLSDMKDRQVQQQLWGRHASGTLPAEVKELHNLTQSLAQQYPGRFSVNVRVYPDQQRAFPPPPEIAEKQENFIRQFAMQLDTDGHIDQGK